MFYSFVLIRQNSKLLAANLNLPIVIGIFTVVIYYNAASKLKFFYTDIKNTFSNDNKYLAVVTDSGLWLKDEINNETLIIKANYIKENFLINVIINKFDSDFDLINTIQSEKINIDNKKWILDEPLITNNNISKKIEDKFEFETNFDKQKINNLFSNISTLNIMELFDLKKDYQKLGYSSDEITIHLLKLFSTPFFYGVLTILSSIIMFRFKKDKSLIFHVLLGILMSVIIYYINFMFSSLGNSGKIPIVTSIFLPILFISLISIIGLISINEK